MRLLVTGATGFIGRALLARATLDETLQLRGSVRRHAPDIPAEVETVLVGALTPETDWKQSVSGLDVIVHTAARVHVMRESAVDPLAEFRRVNVGGTLNLARQAANSGVGRFVFISSIGVNGAETFDVPFSAADKPSPHSPYAVSKHEAELGLRQIALHTGLEVVIIRPPLVFGPGAPGHFNKLLKIVHRGIPLPLGAIHNRRSLVALDNLVDFIMICLRHPAAANGTFLVSDGEDLSTTMLLRRTAAALEVSARLIPVSVGVLRRAASLLGRADLAQQLCGSLQADISTARNLLGWTPPVSVDAMLARTARHFLANHHS